MIWILWEQIQALPPSPGREEGKLDCQIPLKHKQDLKASIKSHIEQENCTFKYLDYSGLQGKMGNSKLTDFLVRFCGDLLPGVGFQVVGVDLEGKRGAMRSSWLCQHQDEAATGSDPL